LHLCYGFASFIFVPHVQPIIELSKQIVFENEDFMIIDKPAGLLVHPSKPGVTGTLIEYIRAEPHLLEATLVNRIDKETSGLVLVAKNKQSAGELGKIVESRAINKEYYAIVTGKAGLVEGVIDIGIGRLGEFLPSSIWLRRAAFPGVEHPKIYASKTGYFIIKEYKNKLNPDKSIYHLHLIPITGRLHQIRVHLSHIGYPIIGDKIYGRDDSLYLRYIETGLTEDMMQELILPRHALHASTLSFRYKEQDYKFTTPLPEDLQGFLNTLEKADSTCA